MSNTDTHYCIHCLLTGTPGTVVSQACNYSGGHAFANIKQTTDRDEVYGIAISAAERVVQEFGQQLLMTGRAGTPAKSNAVYILVYSSEVVGSCFAIGPRHVLTVRHNIFKGNQKVNTACIASCYVPRATAVTTSSTATPTPTSTPPVQLKVVTGGKTNGGSNEDWLILERTDRGVFREHIEILALSEDILDARKPFATVYHYPIEFQARTQIPNFVVSQQNRVANVSNGEIHMTSPCNVSKGSCGGPYVYGDKAIGFHNIGAAENTKRVMVPFGPAFLPGSSVVGAARHLGITVHFS